MKKARGNTLILVTVCIGVIILLLAFFALNYNQLVGGNKQAQSAIDAAALAAAVDISRVVVDTPIGRVALVDDVPAVATPLPMGASPATPLQSDVHPILGINTIMGTLRLDAVIANKLGNHSMAFLVGQDIARTQEAAATLTASIKSAFAGSGSVYDKFGNKINIFVASDTTGQGDVQKAYNANKSVTTNGNQNGLVNIELGYVNNSSTAYTIIPLPSTEQSGNGIQYYPPYQPYSVGSLFTGQSITPQFTGNTNMPSTVTGNFQFAAIAAKPALIDKSSWYSPSPGGSATPLGTYAPPTAVHVYVTQASTALATGHLGRVPYGGSANMQVEAYAEAGGGPTTNISYSAQGANLFASLFGNQPAYAQGSNVGAPMTPSGSLEISFASGGIPGLSQGNQQTAPVNPTTGKGQKLEMASPLGGATINSTASTGPTNQPLFTNVMTMMNASMADPSTGSVTSDAPWTPTSGGGSGTAQHTMASPGNWFVAQGTVTNDSGDLTGPGQFKSLNNTNGNDNPSVALSYIVYDWLKTLGTRPNVQSVYDALTLSDPSLPANTFYGFESLLTGGNAMSVPMNYTIATNQANGTWLPGNVAHHDGGNASSDSWMPPAYASAGSGAPGVINGLEQFGFGDGKNDPRNLDKMSKQDRQRQQQNVWGYVPADATISSNALLVKMADGNAQTVDGHPIGDLYQLWGALAVSARVAQVTKDNAGQIINGILSTLAQQNQQYKSLSQQKISLQNQLQSSPGDPGIQAQLASIQTQMHSIVQSILPQAFQQAPRAYAALINAQYCMHVEGSIYSNFKALTGLGCQRISKRHYVLAGSDYWPTYKVATVAELKGTGPVSTGQDPSLPLADWTAAPIDKGTSQLNFYKHTTAPVVGHLPRQGNYWLQPAVALTASAQQPYENLHFCFYVQGSDPGKGQVHLYVGPDPFINTSGNAIGTLNGQALYQDVQALQTNPTVSISSPTPQEITSAVLSASSRVIEVATTSTSTYTAWQVQARDEAANNFASATANDTTNNAVSNYFAEVNSATAENNNGWCGMSSQGVFSSWQTPQCPALAGEWQLTCPMPASFSWTTYTQYTLPAISYSEDIVVCSDYEPGLTPYFVSGLVASFNVGGVQINVLDAAYSSSYMTNLASLGSFNGQQTQVGTFHS